MSTFIAKQVSGNGTLTGVLDTGEVYTVGPSHLNYTKLKEAFRENDVDTFLDLYDVVDNLASNVSKQSSGKAEVINGSIYYNGVILHNNMTSRMLELLRAGEDINYLLLFLENLMKNQSKRAIDELYKFLSHKNLPITTDGHFLAYKCVRENYLDKHSGTCDNSPGAVLEMARNEVDDDKDRTCSYGYHAGSLEYSGPNGAFWSSSDRVIIVKINPADVVAIPSDYSAQKLRTCKYIVVGDYKGALNKPVYSGNEVDDDDYDADEYSHDEDYENDDNEGSFDLDFADLYEDDSIVFDYEGKKRFCNIDEINLDDEYILGTLTSPETDVGGKRRFLFDKMTNIKFN